MPRQMKWDLTVINLNKNIPYQWEGVVTGSILLMILIVQSIITSASKVEA